MITIRLKGLDEFRRAVSPAVFHRATRAAIARAIRSGKAKASNEIRNRLKFNIRKSDLDRKISTYYHFDSGRLTVIGQPILLSYFNPVETRGQTQTRIRKKRGRTVEAFEVKRRKLKRKIKGASGVRVEIIRGRKTLLRGGRFVNMPVHVGTPFIIRGRGGTPLVVAKRLDEEGKLYTYRIISEVTMFRKVLETVAKRIVEAWENEIRNQARRFGWR